MDQPVGDPTAPNVLSDLPLRLRLIGEELDELLKAIDPTLTPGVLREIEAWLDARRDAHPAPNLVEVADAGADLAYVLCGAFVRWGIALGHVFDEVHRANMAKVGGPIREDGKRLKPPGWTPPDVAGVLDRARLGVYALVETRTKLRAKLDDLSCEAHLPWYQDAAEQIDAIEMRLSQLGYGVDGSKLEVVL